MKFDFSGKTAVVTGGASGIGKAVVGMFDHAGARVLLIDKNEEGGKAVVEHKRNTLFYCADVTEPTALSSILKETGVRPNILVNNAGIEYNDRGNILTMSEDEMRHIIEVNLFGYINMVRVFAFSMKRMGRIINVSSIQALGAHLPGTSYQVAKAGILGLTRALAVELAPREITVNAVLPGAIKTEGMGATRVSESAILDPYRRRIPLGRRGDADEVAAPILFLASEKAAYITGTTLVVDGGYLTNITPDFPNEPTPRVAYDPD